MPAFAVSTCFLAIDSDRTASSRTKCFLSSVHCGPSSLSQSQHVALIDPTCFLGLLRDVAGTFSILFDLATIWTILLRALHLFDPIDASHRQFQDFLADQVDTTRNLSRFTFAQLFKKSARAGSALPSDDTVLLTNTACVGCKKCPVHCLKDGRWRPKPGSKFDNVKSPRPAARDNVTADVKALLSRIDNADQAELARNLSDKLLLLAQNFESLSDAGSSDHNAGSSDPNVISDDEIIDY